MRTILVIVFVLFGVSHTEAQEWSSSRSYRVGTVLETLPHPAGCPRRLFCGCGASLKVFGENRRDLWHVSGWRKFPRAAPGPGMAAVSSRHVMIIEQMVGPNLALVYSANDAGGRTVRIVRSIAGYSIHNPRGGSGATGY